VPQFPDIREKYREIHRFGPFLQFLLSFSEQIQWVPEKFPINGTGNFRRRIRESFSWNRDFAFVRRAEQGSATSRTAFTLVDEPGGGGLVYIAAGAC
jgi:hypothetical protein